MDRLLGAVLFVTALSVTEAAHAGGYHIDEQDARATGRAGAVTANPSNASSIYYNPAGIATLRGLRIDAGGSLVAPRASFEAAATRAETSVDNRVFFLPHAYASYRVSELLGVGVGFNSPFGLSLRWPETSPGRAIVRDIELRSYFVSAVAALDLSRWVPGLSVGAGLDLVPATLRLERDILAGGIAVGSVKLTGNAFGVGARAGILYRPPALDILAFGVTYRSPVKLDVDGDATFLAGPAVRPSLPPDGAAQTSLTLPQKLNFGVAVNFIPEWELELDVDWTNWSTFESLELDLPGNQRVVSDRSWHDTATLRVGTEATLGSVVSLRGGVAWDRTPVPPTTLDFLLPDANRILLAAGGGAAIAPWLRVDLGALYVPPTRQTTSLDDPMRPPIKGTYEVSAFVGTITAGIKIESL